MDLFFLRECPLRIIFSWRMPLEIFFFLGKAFRDLFFPGEGPPSSFFSISSGPPPQIINGRLLNGMILSKKTANSSLIKSDERSPKCYDFHDMASTYSERFAHFWGENIHHSVQLLYITLNTSIRFTQLTIYNLV